MKNYYLLSNGRLKRESHSLVVETADGQKKPIPVEDVDSLYLYGEVDLNTKALNFLATKKIVLHVFNYYGFYSGSYYPREYLHSGHLVVRQCAHYSDAGRRMTLARELVRGAAHSLQRNVAYYANRRGGGKSEAEEAEPKGEIGGEPATDSAHPQDPELEGVVDAAAMAGSAVGEASAVVPGVAGAAMAEPDPLDVTVDFSGEATPLGDLRQTLAQLAALIDGQTEVNALRGVEGKMRERYYQAWQHILSGEWAFDRRVRRPPDNEVNALISFGNSVLYTVCLSELYRTQLTPTISYLHEPGARRFSLALDLSEIFKPLLVDRAIFRLLNTRQLKPEHFDRSLDSCYLGDAGKKLFLAALEERLGATIQHRRLGRHVSYRHLIRLECYKLIRHLTDVEPYRAFRAWW
jgi:CRISPR/Cas system-associated endonuclease Cas1